MMNKKLKLFQEVYCSNKLEALNILADCFSVEKKRTLDFLRIKGYLDNIDFLRNDFFSPTFPSEYCLLFKILLKTTVEIEHSQTILNGLSKVQILQGFANILEKENALIKYCERWNNQFLKEDSYYEAERQMMYSSNSGLILQELLVRYFINASYNNKINFEWNKKNEEKLDTLFQKLVNYVFIRDTIEKHLFFNCEFEIKNEQTLKFIEPNDFQEGSIKNDVVSFYKNKVKSESIYKIAERNSLLTNLKIISDSKANKQNKFKYFPDLKNKEEVADYQEAFSIELQTDLNVELEIAMVDNFYFPGVDGIDCLKLKNDYELNLRQTFRITSYLCELSKKYIQNIGSQFDKSILEYSRSNNQSLDSVLIDKLTKLNKGNANEIGQILKEHYNEEVINDQNKAIENAKCSISDNNCLVKVDYDKLVQKIQWVTQYEKEFIKKVISIFTFSEEKLENPHRTPFFKIGGQLLWLPNMVAYVSFAENLIEVLLKDGQICIHGEQTDLFEKSINALFQRFNYKIITRDKDKTMIKNGKHYGDFDILAFKNGTLIYCELKLTNARDRFFARNQWKKKKLNDAKNQLDKGITYIKENPKIIKRVLGLSDGENITNIQAFITSNSHLFDREYFGKYLKVQYLDILRALYKAENEEPKTNNPELRLVEFIKNNTIFKSLYSKPLIFEDAIYQIGKFKLIAPMLVSRNLFFAED